MHDTTTTAAPRRWLQFLEDNTGALSTTRLITVFVFAVTIIGWITVSLYHWSLAELPASVVTLHGFLLGTKLVQNNQENVINK